MIDHVGVLVSNYGASKRFYERALEPLGYSLVMEVGAAGGFGAGGNPSFWIAESGENAPTATHIAFASPDRATVDAFFETAVAAGGRVGMRGALATLGDRSLFAPSAAACAAVGCALIAALAAGLGVLGP